MITKASIAAAGSGFSVATIRTTSVSPVWAGPGSVVNSADTLRWSVSGGVVIPEVQANNPVIDLSANVGTATVRIRNRDRFSGVSSLNLLGSEITTIDSTRCRNLTSLILQDNPGLTAIELSNNVNLHVLNLRNCALNSLDLSDNLNLGVIDAGNNNLSNFDVSGLKVLTSLVVYNNSIEKLDVSDSVNLFTLHLANNAITGLDISRNETLTDLNIRGNSLAASEIDDIIILLDSFGLANGDLDYANQIPAVNPTAASLASYNNLLVKGWTISGPVPV